MNYKIDMGLLIKDIVMSKGYGVYNVPTKPNHLIQHSY